MTWRTFSERLFAKKNKILEKNRDDAEKNMNIMQDAIAIDQELQYNQQAMNDLLGQATSSMQEGLQDEFDQLGEDEILDAMDGYDKNKQTNTNTAKPQTQTATAKKDTSYDDMLKDLLN